MENNYPKVSIITVNFNGKRYLKRHFDSAFCLNYPKDKIEIIFVDNVSTDNSIEFVQKNYPKVKIIQNDVNNYCKALNLGIKASRAEFVALLNNDTRLDKNWLIELIKVISKDKNIAEVGSKILTMQGKIQNAAHYELPNFYWGERGAGRERKKYNTLEEVSSLCGASVLYRKDVFSKVGLFDEDFMIHYEDVDMSLRLRQKGYKLIFVPTSIVYHKFHGSTNEEFARYYIERNRLLFLAKHYPHKLSSSLMGSEYFTIERSIESMGKIPFLIPEIVLKLIKSHPIATAKKILPELFDEVKRINHLESDILITKFNKMAYDQREINTKLTQNSKALEQIILKREADINQLQQEIQRQLNIVQEQRGELASYRDELTNLTTRFRSRMDEVLVKGGQLIESTAEVNALRGELYRTVEELSAKLINKDDQLLEKDNKIADLRKELDAIYNSEGYRFVLHPLWTATLNAREFLGMVKRKLGKFIWFTISLLLTPVVIFLSLFFLLEYMAWFVFKPLLKNIAPKRKLFPFHDIKEAKISIIIPNYNGIKFLKECLPSIFIADGFEDGRNEVLVVDDGSTDESVNFIKTNFPGVRLLQNKKNMGFGFTCNRGVKAASNEVVVLINNDIILTTDFLRPLIDHLQREDVFAVTPKLYGWDKKTFVWGMHMGCFKEGHIRLWNEAEMGNGGRISQASPSIFAIGGAMVFRKEDFLWLGGFDAIYRPNCWEDIDISYRAWKRGLKIIYEPHSLMYHKVRATLGYERPKEVKNELLFTWKNITDTQILKTHLNLIPWNLYQYRAAFLKGFFWALRYLPQTLLHRLWERSFVIEPEDKKIFNKIMLYYRNFLKRGFRHCQNEKPNVLIVSRFMPYPLNTGGKIRINTLVKLLSDRYNFILLSLIDHEDELKNVPEIKKVFNEVYLIHTKSGLKIDFISKILFPKRYKFALSYSQELIDKLKEIQEASTLDLIHIESNELLYLTDYIQYAPIVYTEHDISILNPGKSYYKRNGHFVSSVFDYLKRFHFHVSNFKKLDRVISLSKEDVEVLRTFFPDTDITLVPTGVDLKHFLFEAKPRKSKKLIFVGHYRHYPNEDAIVYFTNKIFPLIRKRVPEAELLIVGSNPTPRVERLIKEENVRLIGEVNDVNVYLQEADVFVNSVRISAGIKGKVLEAMAAGVPVVSTSIGSYGIDALSEKDILIADDPQEFAEQVIRLLSDDELRGKMVKAARHLVEKKYDWLKIIDKLDKVYNSILFDSEVLKDSKQATIDQILDRANDLVDRKIENLNGLRKPELGPEELHIELTYRCDSKCIMCDLWDYQRRYPKCINELSLDEIRRFVEESRYLQNTKVVVVSGGEPFWRKDIVDICGFFSKHLPDSSIGILTNAMNTDDILIKTKAILDRFHPKSLWLGSSLDGLGKGHDRIRGVDGAFLAFRKTIERCKKELPQVKLSATFTLTPYNIDQLVPAKQFADNEGLDFFAQFVVPKEAREKFIWTTQNLNLAEKEIMKIIQGIIGKTDQRSLFDSIDKIKDKNLISNLYYWSHLLKYQTNPQRFFKKCVSGSKFAMFNPSGDLFFCPNHKYSFIGNIRKESFDNLWMSAEAERMRNFIKEGNCHCWLVCIVFPVLEKALSNC